jgi:hypothetical protein
VSNPTLTDLEGVLRRILARLPADGEELRPALEEALRLALIQAADDIWIGENQISEHIGFSERQIYWMCEQGQVPHLSWLANGACARQHTGPFWEPLRETS